MCTSLYKSKIYIILVLLVQLNENSWILTEKPLQLFNINPPSDTHNHYTQVNLWKLRYGNTVYK